MSSTPSSVRTVLVALMLSLAVGGCVVSPYGDVYDDGFVSVAPPPPRFEAVGPPPYPGWFWIGGNWGWSGNRYVWNRGHWSSPRRGYAWVPQRWDRGRSGWRSRRGHWERR